jgi:dipeptidyl aminopeptidase/acylaminoacyl peptidase
MPDTGSLSSDAERDPFKIASYLSIPTATSPVWRSDSEIVYLSDVSGVPQLWQVALDEDREPRALTNFPNRIGALLNGKDGRLVFGMDTGGNERQQVWAVDASGTIEPITEDPATMHPLGAISPDGNRLAFASNARVRHAFDIWTFDLASPDSAPQLLRATDELLTPLAWTADNQSVVVQRANSNLDHDLLLVPAAGGEAVLLTPHTGEASIPQVAVAPAGGAIFILSNQDREFIALLRLDLTSLEQTVVAAPEWDIESVALAPDGASLAYAINEDGYSRITVRELESRSERSITGFPPGVVSGLRWSPDGSRLAFALTGPTAPPAIWVADRSGEAAQITPSTVVPGALPPFVAPKTIRYPTFDEREIPAYWFVPGDGPGPWPVVVDVHGGPESQRRPEFTAVTQALVAGGIAVLATNVRGSTGYGKTYCHLDDVEKRMDSVADLAAANAWLREQPEVIAERIAVMGQSYGGFMVLSSLTTYPDRWAAGADVVGIANFVTFLEQTGPWRRKTRADEYGDLVRDAELLKQISPIHQVERIVAPLFVIHGRNDPRVPLGESEQIVNKLQELGHEATLLVFDDEGHGMVKRPNRIEGYGAIAGFLARVLNPPHAMHRA